MNPKEISLVISLVLPCSMPAATATLTVPAARQPVRFPKEKPEPIGDHAPHGEGSGELPTVVGLSTSGAMSNVNAMVTTTTWEPLPSIHAGPFDEFFSHVKNHMRRAQNQVLRVSAVTPRHFLPPIRRGC
jgi:hypothetical protein